MCNRTPAAASNDFIKRNFLLSGGGRAIDRAYEDHALQLNKAAMKVPTPPPHESADGILIAPGRSAAGLVSDPSQGCTYPPQDLRNANVALASELAKSQNMAGEECRHLRIECNRLQIELKAETEKHVGPRMCMGCLDHRAHFPAEGAGQIPRGGSEQGRLGERRLSKCRTVGQADPLACATLPDGKSFAASHRFLQPLASSPSQRRPP